MTRSNLILSGILGLIVNIILTAFSIFVVMSGWVSPLVDQSLLVLALFSFLIFFSLAEIPVMIFGMRRMLASINPKAKYVVLVTNFGYTLFAAVYAVPFILFAGKSAFEMIIGALMSALGLVRFITAILFIPTNPYPKTLKRDYDRQT